MFHFKHFRGAPTGNFSRPWFFTVSLISLTIVVSSVGLAQGAPARVKGRPFTALELTDQADVILHGKVASMRAAWSEGKKKISTYVTVSVEEYLKGRLPEKSFTVTHPGGEVDGVGELYTHMPRFKAEEEVIVFAKKDAKGNYRVFGGDQGKVSVMSEKETGKKMVSRAVSLDEFTASLKTFVNEHGDK